VAPPGQHHLHLPPGPSQFIDAGLYSPGIPGQSHAAAFLMHNKNSPNAPNAGGPTQEGKPESFNIAPAIQYLNKIKSRYAEDQNTYKQFLDILQAYQKEQRPLPEVSP
jgi:paired amphipathic helix protein Sin3a